MSSIDFDLVRETARTNWREPNIPWGGIPDITEQGVQQALSQVTHPFGAYLLKAKYTDNDWAAHIVADWMREYSAKLWNETPSLEAIEHTTYSLHRCGELAVLYYLLPKARVRKINNNAAYCKVSQKQWTRYYDQHLAHMWNKLNDISNKAVSDVKKFLYKDIGWTPEAEAR